MKENRYVLEQRYPWNLDVVRHVSFRSILGLLIVSASAAIAYGGQDGCLPATPVEVNGDLQGFGGEGTETFQIYVPSPGVLMLNVALPGFQSAQPKLGFLGRHCAIAKVEEVGWAVLERTVSSLLVDIESPGNYFFRVAAQDPSTRMEGYRLQSRFVGDEDGIVEKIEEWEEDPDLLQTPTCEAIEEWEEDPDLLQAPPRKTTMEERDEPGLFVSLLLKGLCRLGEVDDHGDAFGCASLLIPGESVAGEVRNDWGDDADVFTFTLTAQRTIRLESIRPTDTLARLYDRQGHRLAADDDGGGGESFRIVKTLGPGRYFLRVEGSRAAEGPYRLAFETSRW